MKRWLAAALTVCLLVGVTGCNTMRGLGEDIEEGGEAVQRASD
ncbi:entericidin A/B family lipoprotein [Aidingimonas halophila]|uniref:Entericidin B n=1 Tax=Aidingimonas halophila TaxID=574349 RepID=A0A1H2Z4V8_9GAMM|nr:entericidin A/B family lipoprotein [Aidingimonas halophila]SDX12462.1 entericidin B [Aidingimonas halophila]